ncbi:MAG: peptidylprolyl isomerase [Alphaproteobacteria bacterium]|nr:peptidylprolyl isomerase [Alphaproteobacteria bacterium]
MNLKYVTAAAALAVVMLGFAAPPVSAQNAEGVAAIVNDKVISTFDVRQRATMLLLFANLQPTPELLERARSQALRDLVDEQLQVGEAAKFEINVAGDAIDRRMAEMAQRSDTTLDNLTGELSRNGVSITTLRSQIRAEIAWQRLIAGMYGSRVRISERDITDTQQRIAANARRPQYEMSEIFLPADTPEEFNQMEQGAMRLLEQMQQRAPFPMVARQFSQSPSAAAGGDLGWISANELSPELRPIAERLQPGQVSLPVRTQTGVYIIAMRNRREGIADGAASIVSLRQISAPVARSNALDRIRRRATGCSDLDSDIRGIQGASVLDLGQTIESDLSADIRTRLTGVAVGGASTIVTNGDQANIIMLCARETGGAAIPDRAQIEDRLREAELSMLAERHLRNLRREATIITRQ